MKNLIASIVVCTAIFGICSAQDADYPKREGIALGYMSTPNSLVYRMMWSENSAFDLWLDIPEMSFGDVKSTQAGGGFGYAMFLARGKHAGFMLRPQCTFRYVDDDIWSRTEVGMGAAASAVAFLDSTGLPNVDVYAGITLGAYASFGNNLSSFSLIAANRGPFGVFVGVMKYF